MNVRIGNSLDWDVVRSVSAKVGRGDNVRADSYVYDKVLSGDVEVVG